MTQFKITSKSSNERKIPSPSGRDWIASPHRSPHHSCPGLTSQTPRPFWGDLRDPQVTLPGWHSAPGGGAVVCTTGLLKATTSWHFLLSYIHIFSNLCWGCLKPQPMMKHFKRNGPVKPNNGVVEDGVEGPWEEHFPELGSGIGRMTPVPLPCVDCSHFPCCIGY